MQSDLCDGPCDEGYYCEEGSTSPKQHRCGNSTVYCRFGSSIPKEVDIGYYSGKPQNIFECIRLSCYNIVGGLDNSTRSYQKKCEPGFYCVDGVRKHCYEGFFGAGFGLVTNYNSSYRLFLYSVFKLQTHPNCSGPCSEGKL